MVVFIECIVACVLFTLLVAPSVVKNPLAWYHSYPKAIQARIASLPQYEGKIPTQKRNLKKKIISLIIVCLVLTAVCLLTGKTTFPAAFLNMFAVAMSINLWDLIAMDLLWFCHSKRVRVPGTEDMDKEYRSVGRHFYGFALGTAIAVGAGLVVGGLVELVGLLM